MALALFLVLCLFTTCCKADARSKILADEQNHSTVSDIIMVDNDFECVDIHKQPALQHPLLKNHKIQLYPTFAKNIMRSGPSYGKTMYKCPEGKVIIYNKTRRHQIITNSSSKLQIDDFQQYSKSAPGYHTVSFDTPQTMIYHGAYAGITEYNLSLEANYYSISSIWIENGPPTELNSIKVGVGVHPSLYGDSQLRLTSDWTANGYKKTGCYNYCCPSFVQVDRNKTLCTS